MAARPQNIGIKAIELYTPSQVSETAPSSSCQFARSVEGHEGPLFPSCSFDLDSCPIPPLILRKSQLDPEN